MTPLLNLGEEASADAIQSRPAAKTTFEERDPFEEVLRGSTPNGNQNKKHFIQMLRNT